MRISILFDLIGGPKQLPLYAFLAADPDPVVGVLRPRSARRCGRHVERLGAASRLLYVVDGLSAAVGKTFGWCILVLTFTTSYEVFARYMFGAPTEWAFDASYMLYGTLFMMAGAYALSRNGHVRGDFLYRAWSPRRQAGMDLVLYFLFFFPGMLAFIYSGYGFAELSRADERAFLGQPERPDRVAVQVAHPDRRLPDGAAGHRRGDPLHHGAQDRRMAAAPARRRGAGKGHAAKRPRRRKQAEVSKAEDARPAQGGHLMFGLGNPELGVLMLALFVVFIMFGFPDRLHADGARRVLRLLRDGRPRLLSCSSSAPIR